MYITENTAFILSIWSSLTYGGQLYIPVDPRISKNFIWKRNPAVSELHHCWRCGIHLHFIQIYFSLYTDYNLENFTIYCQIVLSKQETVWLYGRNIHWRNSRTVVVSFTLLTLFLSVFYCHSFATRFVPAICKSPSLL